ncbi:MAG: hypothetical protein AAFR96_00510 [Planctomycetota bacterium]
MSQHDTTHAEAQGAAELDPWHTHTDAEGVPQKENAPHINVPALMIGFAATAVFVGGLVIVLLLYYNHSRTQLATTRLENTVGYSEIYVPQRDASIERITTYRPIDTEAGTVQVPVDRAIDQVISEYGG